MPQPARQSRPTDAPAVPLDRPYEQPAEVTRPSGPQDALGGSPEGARASRRERERRIASLANRQHGLIAAWQLRSLGVSTDAVRRRVETCRLRRRFAGVYSVGAAPLTEHGRWAGAVLACGPGALLSYLDAGGLWKLTDRTTAVVDVSVAGTSRSGPSGVRRHGARALRDQDRAVHEGIPVTTVERTLLDLASVLPMKALGKAFDEAARRRLVDFEVLADLVRASRGKRGLSKLRRLLAYDPAIAARTKSPLERMLLDLCTREGLPLPLVNVRVGAYEVDAYWPDAHLVVELDGHAYHRTVQSMDRDHRKTAELTLAGYIVLRLTYTMLIAERPWVLARLRDALAATGRHA